MNNADREVLKELWKKYGKDEIYREIDMFINPSNEVESNHKSRPRGRIQTKTPEALAGIYCFISEMMWRHNLNISQACEKVASSIRVEIDGNETKTVLSAGIIGFDAENIRQWYNNAKTYRTKHPESIPAQRMNHIDQYLSSLPSASEYDKEMQLIKEKYNL